MRQEPVGEEQKKQPFPPRVHLGSEKRVVVAGSSERERKKIADLCRENIFVGSGRPLDFGLEAALEYLREIEKTGKFKCMGVICCCEEGDGIPVDFLKKIKALSLAFQKKGGEGDGVCALRILVIGCSDKELVAQAMQHGADDYLIKSETLIVGLLRKKLAQLLRLRSRGANKIRRFIDEGKALAREGLFDKAIEKGLEAHALSQSSASVKFIVANLFEQYGDHLRGQLKDRRKKNKEPGRAKTDDREMKEKAESSHAEALRWYSEAVRMNPLFIKAILALSDLLHRQGMFFRESMALNQLKEASPGSPETFIKMGRNRLELGRLKEAQQFFMRATVKVRGKDILRKAYIFHKIAETYKDNGKLMEAEKNYRQSLDYIKESELWRKTRIVMKYKKIKGETRAVLEEAPLAFEQRQRIVEIYKGYMSVLLKQVKQEREWDKIHREIIKAGEEALKFNPVEEKIWVYLSKAYERLGNREEAEKCRYNYRFFLQL